jgi:uncharacterized membrane protein YfcA
MFLAAFFAGVVNSIAGGGMLLVFPMMIWLGLDPKVANATCTVALVPGLFGGLFGYRRTMDDSSIILMRLGAVSLVGGGIGAWLLIKTPSPTFARLVPFLILFATLLFMVQGPVNRWLRLPSVESESTRQSWIIVMVIQFFSAMYGGYFGAGNGILMLAAMGLIGLRDIHRANGIKNFLGICINGIAVFSFSIAHMVSWPRALWMAIAATIGGYVGASAAQKVGGVIIRRTIVVIGFVITIVMLWRMRESADGSLACFRDPNNPPDYSLSDIPGEKTYARILHREGLSAVARPGEEAGRARKKWSTGVGHHCRD